jgi:hypothetical protein
LKAKNRLSKKIKFINERPNRPYRPKIKKLDATDAMDDRKQTIFFLKNMTTDFRYKLIKRGKAVCPQCERKTFVLYIDTETGNPLHSTVGKCDRSDNCGHHYSPKQYFADNGMNKQPYISIHTTPKPQPKKAVSFIDNDVFKKTLVWYDSNILIKYLYGVVGIEKVMPVVDAYHVGTTKNGGSVFWQIDNQNKVRSGKIIHYKTDGHRNHDIMPNWVHSTLKLPDFNLSQVLFGEHLLRDSTKVVAIVESEKTAIIASVYLPSFTWLATGGKQNFSLIERCAALKSKKVVLFPDLKAFDDWKTKATELKSKLKIDISVSDLLEKNANEQERAAGLDIADYLLKQAPSTVVETADTQVTAVSTAPEAETTPAVSKTTQDKRLICYVSDTGTLYIPTPPDCKTTYTVRESVEAYNNRTGKIGFMPMQDVDVSGMRQVFINHCRPTLS